MSGGHTPGPWVVKFRSDGSSYISMGGLEPGQRYKQFDILLHRDSGNDAYDAHLIAAAPDLLAALEYCAREDGTHPANKVAVAKAAIAKARVD